MNTTQTKFKEFPFRIDEKLKHKLDRLASTLNKKDVWILIDGEEGSGKTNTATYLLYYFHCITGREFTLEHFYFDTDELFNWVKDNSDGLVNWDEAALGGLSSEWREKSQINLIKFGSTGRIKHHIFIYCVPYFNELKPYLRKDRPHAMIHMDLGKKGNAYGHFSYLTKRGIRILNDIYTKTKKRKYGFCMRKFGGFYGNIPYVLNKLIDEKVYEENKIKAISNIGKKKDKVIPREKYNNKMITNFLMNNSITAEKKAELLGIHRVTVFKLIKLIKEGTPLDCSSSTVTDIINNANEGQAVMQ
jgi:hypothetical protein